MGEDYRWWVFDLNNRYVALTVPNDLLGIPFEKAVTTYPRTEPVTLTVKLLQITPDNIRAELLSVGE